MSYTGGDKGETREIAPEGVFGLSSTLICVSEFIEFYLPWEITQNKTSSPELREKGVAISFSFLG